MHTAHFISHARRWTMRGALITVAMLVLMALTFGALGITPALAAGPGAGWAYQRSITLSTSTPSANFQIRVQLTDLSNMAANGNDLRFYDSSGVQADYWIEYWNTNPAGQATVWVEVPTAGTTSLTMYYGNAGAAAASNGNNTFIAFDDFSGGAVDTAKWTVLGNPSQSGGSVTISANQQLTSKTPFNMSAGTMVETVLGSNINFATGSRMSMSGASSLTGGTMFRVDEPVNSQFAAWSNGRDNVHGIHIIHEGDGVDNGTATSQYLAVFPAGGAGTWPANGYTLGTAFTSGRLEYFLNSTPGGWVYNSLGSSVTNIPTATMYPVLGTVQESFSVTTFRVRRFAVGYNPTVTVGSAVLIACTATNNGNWSNIATWDCGVVPTAGVDVTISSGRTVTLDMNTADLANVTIGSGGILQNNGTARTLRLTGNWSNSGTFTPGTSINVQFDGTGTQTLTGSTTFNNLTISNTGGSVTLANDMTVNGTLMLNSDLTTSSKILTLGSGATVAGAKDVVGTVRRTSFSGAQQYNNQYTTLNFVTAPSQMDVVLQKSAPSGFSNAVTRQYTLTPTGSVNATVQLAYQTGELNGNTEGNLQLWRYDSGTSKWVLQGGTVNTTNHYVLLAGVTQFSPWAISGNGNGPTAVSLSSFKAESPSFDLGAWLRGILGR